MSTRNNAGGRFFSKMVVRLWLLMMTLVVLIIALMWGVQIYVLERNYINVALDDMQERLSPLTENLDTVDLADDVSLLRELSRSANGKMLLVDADGQLIGMYSLGHAIDLDKETAEIRVWQNIQDSDEYQSVLNRESYTREIRYGNKLYSYEIGLPTLYQGTPAYVILYQSFSELYEVLDMNRRQLVVFSVLLTVLSALLAVVLSKKFIKPIGVIKTAVDKLASGDLTAKPELHLHDEVGRLSESVEQLGTALQRVDTLRKEVIANVSHELRSPLALIGGYAEMARDVHRAAEPERNEDLNLIISESRRMSEMVSDILDYSLFQAGYLQLHKDWYNLHEIVESEVFFCEQSAANYQITIELDADVHDAAVYVDALKISRALRNLLYNAINHTKSGNSIRVELREETEHYKVSVKNAGDPIPEEERTLIWERYQRSQHQGGRSEGTGIGLSIVSAILKSHEMTYGVACADGIIDFWFRCPKTQSKKE